MSRVDVEAAFRAVYGAEQPTRRAPQSDDAGIEGINAYRGDASWHLVTIGLPEHELTLLVPPAEEPPDWAFALLLGTALTLAKAGRPLHAGARLAPGAPLDGERTGLTALGVRADPLVPGPFLQLVGVTAGEFAVMQKVGTELVLQKLAERDPLLRTDPARAQPA